MTAAPQTGLQQQPRVAAPPATGEIREFWNQTKAEYEQALAIATQIWTINHPTEALNAVAATLLIHFDKMRENHRRAAERQADRDQRAANRQASSQGKPASGPSEAPACEQCGGEMYDNRQDKKTPRSPDYRCKDQDCGHAVWLTPPPRRKGGNRQ